jgi:hypothetical protein
VDIICQPPAAPHRLPCSPRVAQGASLPPSKDQLDQLPEMHAVLDQRYMPSLPVYHFTPLTTQWGLVR